MRIFPIAINGYYQALACPLASRQLEIARASAINDLAKKFVRDTKAERKKSNARKHREVIVQEQFRDPLLLTFRGNIYDLEIDFLC